MSSVILDEPPIAQFGFCLQEYINDINYSLQLPWGLSMVEGSLF